MTFARVPREDPPLLHRPRRRAARYRPLLIAAVLAAAAVVIGLTLALGGRPASRSPPQTPAERAQRAPDSPLPRIGYDLLSAAPPPARPAVGGEAAPTPAPTPPAKPRRSPTAATLRSEPDPALSPVFFASENGSAGRAGEAAAVVTPALRPRRGAVVAAGDVIPAALLTAIDSDLPGEVLATVTADVFGHGAGAPLAIPQGSRLVGRLEVRPGYGETRAAIAWKRLVLPDGREADLGGLEAADAAGQSGLSDRVDPHVGPILRAIAITSALTIGGAAAQNAEARGSGGLVLNDAAGGVAAHASEVGGRLVDRDLRRAPTLTVRAGWPLAVIVQRDLVIEAAEEVPPDSPPRSAEARTGDPGTPTADR